MAICLKLTQHKFYCKFVSQHEPLIFVLCSVAVDYVNINENACVTCEPCARDVPPQNVCALTTVSNAGTLPGEHVVFFSYF